MKNKNGFTLIEMLAVIVILGLLIAIAIPSISHTIEKSRKKAYIDNAIEYISSASQAIAKGEILIRNTNTTYYIHINNIRTEKGTKTSPYGGEFDAYVVVTLDENNKFTFYWTSIDSGGHYVPITEEKDLKIESIIDGSDEQLLADENIGERTVRVVYDRTGEKNTYN